MFFKRRSLIFCVISMDLVCSFGVAAFAWPGKMESPDLSGISFVEADLATASFPFGYRRWDSVSPSWGLFGMTSGCPIVCVEGETFPSSGVSKSERVLVPLHI